MGGFSTRPKDHRGREVRGRYGLWRSWLVALPVLGGVMMMWTIVLGSLFDPSSMLSLRLVLIGVACLVAILPALVAFRAHPGRLVPRRLAAGKCGACAYPISTLPREPDGCTVCPECGGAWKLKGETKGQRGAGTKGMGG